MAEQTQPRPGLIDTDILVDVLRGFAPAAQFVGNQVNSPAGMAISSITEMELIVGCTNTVDLRRVQILLMAADKIHVSKDESLQAVNWLSTYRLSHGLTVPDALIAASALISGLPLYTKNTRHFQMLPSLHLIRPY